MSLASPPVPGPRVAGFRLRLLIAMMLVVSAITGLALYFAQRSLTANVQEDLERGFQSELEARQNAQEVRYAALVERCRALVRKPRIQAAFEDNALDLLYPNAEDELRDMLERGAESTGEPTAPGLRAKFYRFLDRNGAVIPPPGGRAVGTLRPEEEAQLVLPRMPESRQIGYLVWQDAAGVPTVSEVIAMPIASTETGEALAALVLGFKPFEFGGSLGHSGMKSGIWFGGRLHATSLSDSAARALMHEVTSAVARPGRTGGSLRVAIDGVPHLLFSKRLNPASLFPPAYEICVYPLSGLIARQSRLRWQVIGAGALLLLVGLGASHLVSTRLSAPVEKLAVDSEENRARRARAEAALEMTSAELQRSARFSADASHQLKTPVTVLRAGLEELLARDRLTPEECDEISALIHQTYRLSSLIEDLLLLSRMDAGRLKLTLTPVNLTQLIEAALDDLGAVPDELEVAVETDFPSELHIAGEKRYTAIILQNLLENARKYNRPGGRIRLTARADGDPVFLSIGNTGRSIPEPAQAHIFERFHRGAMGENVPGYGLGLNLARELARLHQGDLRLVQSADDWTEFEVRFRMAAPVRPRDPDQA